MSDYLQVHTSDPGSDSLEVMTSSENGQPQQEEECILYRRRWFILSMFVLFAALSLMQWIQYSVIADAVVKYYDISYETSNWTSLVYLLIYIPCLFPGSYLLQKLGLRISILVGIILTCIGSWIKVTSVNRNKFYAVLVGQSIVAVSHVLILPVAPRIAAIWFGPHEVSSATSIGVFGVQLGIGLGFLIPPLLIDGQAEVKEIERGLYIMTTGTAVACTILMAVLFAFFKNEPPTPPSPAQLKIKENKVESMTFTQSIKTLLFFRPYLQLLFAYAIILGIFNAVSALLNQIILNYYPWASKDVGIIGFAITLAGMTGSISLGIILDKFKKFRETTIGVYMVGLGGMLIFSFTVDKGLPLVYALMVVLGFSLPGFKTVAFEVAAELTYPIPEGTSGGLLTVASQILGIVFTYLYSFLFYNIAHIWANITMTATLLLGLILVATIRYNLKRHAAQNFNNVIL